MRVVRFVVAVGAVVVRGAAVSSMSSPRERAVARAVLAARDSIALICARLIVGGFRLPLPVLLTGRGGCCPLVAAGVFVVVVFGAFGVFAAMPLSLSFRVGTPSRRTAEYTGASGVMQGEKTEDRATDACRFFVSVSTSVEWRMLASLPVHREV